MSDKLDAHKEVAKPLTPAGHDAGAGEVRNQNLSGATNENYLAAKIKGGDTASSALPSMTLHDGGKEAPKDGATPASAAGDATAGAPKDGGKDAPKDGATPAPAAAGDATGGSPKVGAKDTGGSWFNKAAHAMLSGFEIVGDTASSALHSVGDKAAAAGSEVGVKAGNILDIGKTLVVGTGEAALDAGKTLLHGVEGGVVGAGHALASGADWAVKNPGKTAALVGAGVVAGVVEVSTGGLATPLLAAGAQMAGSALAAAGGMAAVAEGAGLAVAGVQTVKAGVDVYKHGDLGTLYNQENHTDAENKSARDRLMDDTGKALLTDVPILGGIAFKALSSAADTLGAAEKGVGGAAEATIAIGGRAAAGSLIGSARAAEAGPVSEAGEAASATGRFRELLAQAKEPIEGVKATKGVISNSKELASSSEQTGGGESRDVGHDPARDPNKDYRFAPMTI